MGGILQAGVRAFRPGQYAATRDGLTAFIYEVDHEENQIAICERDEERTVSASELTNWSPQNGSRVTEIDNEGSPVGIVVEAGEEISQVVWTGLRSQVSFVNSRLEPVWD